MSIKKLSWLIIAAAMILSLTACVSSDGGGKTPDEIYNEIKSAVELPELQAIPAAELRDVLGIDMDTLAAYIATRSPDPMSSDSVIIFLCNDGDQAAAAAERLQKYLDSARAMSDNYAPDAHNLLMDTEVIKSGSYTYLVVLQDDADVLKIIRDGIK